MGYKIFILKDENGARVDMEIFFSLPLELVLAPFVDELHELHEWKPDMTRTMLFLPISMMEAILYARFHENMSNRAFRIIFMIIHDIFKKSEEKKNLNSIHINVDHRVKIEYYLGT